MKTPTFNVHPAALVHGAPNNAFIASKMKEAAEAKKRNGAMAGMGDYISALPYRVLATKGASTPGGPVMYPTIPAPEAGDAVSLLTALLEEVRRLPENFSIEARTRFPIAPREAISFINPSLDITVPPGTGVAVVRQLIPERFTGFLTHVGVNTMGAPPTAILWQIRVNGAIHPEFSNRQFTQNHVANPLPFIFELTQARTLELVAINTAGAPIVVQGILVGWTEFMSSFKSYGSSPQSGVS